MKEEQRNWIDISQPLSKEIGHWPGDTPFSFEVLYSKQQTGSVNIGRMITSLHTGTHIDAPFHYDNDGKKIHELDVNIFIGVARVIDVSDCDSIGMEELKNKNLEGVSRLLLRTAIPNNPHLFPKRIPYLREELGLFLKEKGIQLIGVDVPSVDPLDSKELRAHHALHRNGIHILENVMLDHVEVGDYELIALPLPIYGADGSPVRAVIRPMA